MRRTNGGAIIVCSFALILGWGCSGGSSEKNSGVAESKLPQGATEAIEHEACEEKDRKVVILDANGDGKPDIKRVFDPATGTALCLIADFNHDGKPEMYEYYGTDGIIRRRESSFEKTEAISQIDTFEGGRLVKRELDTTGQRRIDTWDYFDAGSGKRTKRERDVNGDHKIDQWWTFDGSNVTIDVDRDGDGKPDPGASITLGGGGGVDAGVAVAPTGSGGSSLPPPPPPPVLMPSGDDAGAPADAGKKPPPPPPKKK